MSKPMAKRQRLNRIFFEVVILDSDGGESFFLGTHIGETVDELRKKIQPFIEPRFGRHLDYGLFFNGCVMQGKYNLDHYNVQYDGRFPVIDMVRYPLFGEDDELWNATSMTLQEHYDMTMGPMMFSVDDELNSCQ